MEANGQYEALQLSFKSYRDSTDAQLARVKEEKCKLQKQYDMQHETLTHLQQSYDSMLADKSQRIQALEKEVQVKAEKLQQQQVSFSYSCLVVCVFVICSMGRTRNEKLRKYNMK